MNCTKMAVSNCVDLLTSAVWIDKLDNDEVWWFLNAHK